MSISFQSKDSLILGQQLRVQELVIGAEDVGLYIASGGAVFVNVQEPVLKVYIAYVKVNAGPSFTVEPAASISIVDSVALTAGGDQKVIKISSLTLAANDVLVLKYVIDETK
jgi:hypothetical protein